MVGKRKANICRKIEQGVEQQQIQPTHKMLGLGFENYISFLLTRIKGLYRKRNSTTISVCEPSTKATKAPRVVNNYDFSMHSRPVGQIKTASVVDSYSPLINKNIFAVYTVP